MPAAAMDAQSSKGKKGKTKTTASAGIKGKTKVTAPKTSSTNSVKNDIIVVQDKENLANCFFGYEDGDADGDMNVPVEEQKTACESTTSNGPTSSSTRLNHVHYIDPNFIAGKKSNVVENHPYNFAFEGGVSEVISKTKKIHLDPYYQPVAGKQNVANEINPYNFAFGGDETVNLSASNPRKGPVIDPAQAPIAGQKATTTEIYPFNFAFAGETERISYSSKSKKAPIDPAQTPVAGLKATVTEVFPYNFSWGSCEVAEETKTATVMTTPASINSDIIYGKKATVTETHPYYFGWGGVDKHEKDAEMSTKDFSNSPVAGKKNVVQESHPYYFAFDANAENNEASSSSSSSSSSASTQMIASSGGGGIASVDGKRKKNGSINSSSVVDLTIIHGRPSVTEAVPPFSLVWDTQTSNNSAADELPIPPPLLDTVAGKPSYKADTPPPFFAWEGPGPDLPSSSAVTTSETVAVLMPPPTPSQIYGRPSFKAESPPVYYAWSGAAGEEEKADKQSPTPTQDKIYGRPSFKAESPPVYYAWSGAAGEEEKADKQSPTPTQDKIYGRPSFKAESPPVYYAWSGTSAAVHSDEKNLRQGSVDPSFVAGRPNVVVERPPYYYAWPEKQSSHASPLLLKDARKIQYKDDGNTEVISYFTAPPPAIPQPPVTGTIGTSSVPIGNRKSMDRVLPQGSCPSTPIPDRQMLKKNPSHVDDSKMTMMVTRPNTAVTKATDALVSKVMIPPKAITTTATGMVLEKGNVATLPRRVVVKVVSKSNVSKVPQKQSRPVATPTVSVVRPRTASGRMEGSTQRDPTLVNQRYPPSSDKQLGRWASTSRSNFTWKAKNGPPPLALLLASKHGR